MIPELFFAIDVESVGLHGEGFAVGWVVTDSVIEHESGKLVTSAVEAAGGKRGHDWVTENVPLQSRYSEDGLTLRGLHDFFWQRWRHWKGMGAYMVADCGWPVEARFLAACVDDGRPSREDEGPYPLHELASFLAAAGMDPMAIYDRHDDELPIHDPLADARQSARLLRTALRKLRMIGGHRGT
jgi:hypothetical protein